MKPNAFPSEMEALMQFKGLDAAQTSVNGAKEAAGIPSWKRNARILAISVLTLSATHSACRHYVDQHAPVWTASAVPSIASPSRPLVWGDVNFIHTTDSHGWLLGHQKASQPEPNGSGTLGDLCSFVHHMKRRAAKLGVDLLLVDSGDLHDGNGLTDGFPKGGVNGHETNKFFAQLPYDVLAIGNHELYKYNVARDVHTNFAPKWNGRYLTSNVNITVVSPDGAVKNVPIGERYTKFETSMGRKVTAFGVLFDFANNANNTTIQKAEDLVAEAWFQQAIKDEPDFFLLLGHMAVVKSNWPIVFGAIRLVHPTTPIFIFGGHTHIRDCVMLDERSMALESGRYMETVGEMAKFVIRASVRAMPLIVSAGATLPSDSKPDMSFTRRYLDANRVTYQYHTNTTEKTFDTKKGKQITSGLHKLAKRFHLNKKFGVAPHDYYLDRFPHTSNFSVVSLFIDKVLPTVLPVPNPAHANRPLIVIANTGSQRFDIFKGPFTRNDQFIVSPFGDPFLFLTVPYGVARRALDKLNEYGAFAAPHADNDDAFAESRFSEWRKEQWNRARDIVAAEDGKPLTLGYVTSDTCPGGPGDDTPHAPIPYFEPPGYVAHSHIPPGTSNDTLVDVVCLHFFSKDLVRAVNDLGWNSDVPWERNRTVQDLRLYSTVESSDAFGAYAQIAWKK